MGKIYGYCRISKATQNVERQIRNIKELYPDAVIYQEAYTGTKIDGRVQFNRLIRTVKDGDTIVFDSVSRMSRNADEGVKLYFELYNRGVNLIFLKERYINTSVYQENINQKIELTGSDEDVLFEGINKYFIKLAERQIRIAFEQAEKEIIDLRQRTKEGIEIARQQGKQIGQVQGATFKIKKKQPIQQIIQKYNKDFLGNLKDSDTMSIINGTTYIDANGNKKTYHISNNTYYKYKKELAERLQMEEYGD